MAGKSMRNAARTDSNQALIVSAMRNMGAYVYLLKLPVDLLVGVQGQMALVEVKTLVGKRDPKAAPYTQLQVDFMAAWTGPPVVTVCTVDEAVELVQRMRRQALVEKIIQGA